MNTGKNHVIPSLVLGINDGLIELTGALVGFSFALRDPGLVALSGLITGVAASLSMAASAFMQARHEEGKDAPKAAIYTGLSYSGVVLFLVLPYLFLRNVRWALLIMLGVALVIIAVTTYFTSRMFNRRFLPEFAMMLVFSLGVATVAFLLGLWLRSAIGVKI